MLNILFFVPLGLYFAAMLLQFLGMAFKKDGICSAAWILMLVSFAVHSAYILVRGIQGGRLPLSNQFEFATAFAWGVILLAIVLRLAGRHTLDWAAAVALPMGFLVLSYAALQARPDEIAAELMPSLRSSWFALHIGSAVFSYSGFAVSACISVRYLLLNKKRVPAEPDAAENPNAELDSHLSTLDTLSYKLICFGFLLLSVVILSGCVWAEQAWGTFWSWDPKETWALITWIIYAILLHQRIRKHWNGAKMARFSVIAFVCVLFTFVGVNKLLAGLHSYAD